MWWLGRKGNLLFRTRQAPKARLRILLLRFQVAIIRPLQYRGHIDLKLTFLED